MNQHVRSMTVASACRTVSPALGPACERCHMFKQKCHFTPGQSKCSTCHRLGKICRSRNKKRMGRRPVVKDFPHGSHSLITFSTSESPEASDYQFGIGKPREETKPPVPWSPSPVTFNIPITQNPKIARVLTSKDEFFRAHCHFMIGRTFNDDFHAIALQAYVHSPHILSDAYFALLQLLGDHKAPDLQLETLDLTLGARGLRALLKLQSSITQLSDAVIALTLGQILLAYNALLPLGSSTRTIIRGSLLAAQTWFPKIYQHPSFDNLTIILVLVDTIDCLFRRKVPVVQLPTTDRIVVDRSIGICSGLLSLLYDLCVCSHQQSKSKSQPQSINPPYPPPPTDPYTEIEHKIQTWTPTPPRDFTTRYTPHETTIMTTQAATYRLASLLLIHRLRYPLGIHDGPAIAYASAIITALAPLSLSLLPHADCIFYSDSTSTDTDTNANMEKEKEKEAEKSTTTTPCTGLALDFPLFVAMLELPTSGTRLFQAFEPMRYRRRQGRDLLDFASKIQDARRDGYRGLWFDLVGDCFRGDFLP